MKRNLLMVMLVTLVIFLTGCVSVNQIKDNFADAGYVYSETASSYISNLLEGFDEEEVSVDAYVFSNGIRVAVVLEFNSTKEMNDELESNEDLQALIGDLTEKELIRGNMLLIPIGITTDAKDEMISIFND